MIRKFLVAPSLARAILLAVLAFAAPAAALDAASEPAPQGAFAAGAQEPASIAPAQAPAAVLPSSPEISPAAAISPLAPPASESASKALEVAKRAEVEAVLKEFNTVSRGTIKASLERAGRFLPLVRRELEHFGLPVELAALPFVESHYNPRAISGSNAVGLWQFVASTARLYGLKVDFWIDERFDPVASTRAAARHLADLFAKFGDWDLVLAAYNAGAGCIDRAKAPFAGKDFWDLCSIGRIRPQTKRYVPKFHAALAIMQDPASFGYGELAAAEPFAYESVLVDSPVSLASLARRLSVRTEELAALNPALRRGATPPGAAPFELKVPVGAGELAQAEVERLTGEERIEFRRHRVAPGDSLWKIAQKYGADPDAIVAVNRLSNPKKLKTGSELAIQVIRRVSPANSQLAAAKNPPERVPDAATHVVASGDTLWSLSKRYGVDVAELKRLNSMSRDSLAVGATLRLREDEAAFAARGEAGKFHTVASGDTLNSIARRNGVSVARLREINRLSEGALLHPGDRLKVDPEN